MGIYRFLLAAVVVLFHFGGLSWVTGRVAVFGFYCVSGFLIFQVLDRVYLDERGGIARFFINRVVRLGPSYLLYTLITVGIVALSGTRGSIGADGRPVLSVGTAPSAELVASTLTFAPSLSSERFVPVLQFAPPLIPQGWSIGIELSFYLMAPLVVLATRRQPVIISLWVAGGFAAFLAAVWASGFDFARFQETVYKNAVASWFVFFAGGGLYYARRRWGQPFRIEIFLPLALGWVLLLAAPAFGWTNEPPRSPAVFTRYLWLTLLPATVVALTQASRWTALDRMAGNLCYAIYLNHFVVAAVLVWMDAASVLGAPGTLLFGGAVLAGSALLGAATYQLVERPFESLRARVRGDTVRAPQGVPLKVPFQVAGVAAGVIVAVLVTPPVGVLVEQVAASGPGEELRVSPPFDVRWKPGITDAGRRAVEQELGLVDAERVLRDPRQRTWSYRLRRPTTGRVRDVVTHDAVEDTARIDRREYVILQ